MLRNGLLGLRVPVLAIAVGIVVIFATAGCGGGGASNGGGTGGGGGNAGGVPGTLLSVRLQIPVATLEGLTLALDDPVGTHVVQRSLHDGDEVVQIELPEIPSYVPEVLLRPSITRADRSYVWQWVMGGQYPRGQACYLFHNSDVPGEFWSVGWYVEGRITSFASVSGVGVIQAVVLQ